MEGYSVTEAASVLGVPVERVWELLARGVLAGAPEGETGMRVFLQPRPPAAPPREEPERTNGHGSAHEPERELSPFRELLTEFRNLTERYGQALLALGESRGEVAALRSRVDLLEARMDLRLPGGGPLPPSPGWGTAAAPFPAERPVTPTVPPPTARDETAAHHDADAVADHEAADEATEHRARARGPRRATESFAEALARAEDPSVPELPGSAEVAEALAAMRAEPSEPEAVLPREVPVADEVPVAEEPRVEPEPVPEAEAAPEVEPVRGAEAPPEPAEPEPAVEAAPEPPAWDEERYTSAIDEPDWFEAEAEAETGAEESGAAEIESAGASGSEPAAQHLPGSSELSEALAALDAIANEPPSMVDEQAASAAPSAPQTSTRPAAPIPSSALRYRPVGPPAGPAGRAYRRLRRIFPD